MFFCNILNVKILFVHIYGQIKKTVKFFQDESFVGARCMYIYIKIYMHLAPYIKY